MPTKFPLERHIKDFERIHNTEEFRKQYGFDHYDYSLITEINKNAKSPVVCNIHKITFWIKYGDHKTGYGCKLCGIETVRSKLRLSNEEVDRRLILAGDVTERMEPIFNTHTKIKWRCKNSECGNIWLAKPMIILNQNCGCPKCNLPEKITNELVDFRLQKLSKNFKRNEDVIDGFTKIKWKCNLENCKYEWSAAPCSVLFNESNCPKCSGVAKLTDEYIDTYISSNNIPIKRIGSIEKVNTKTKIEWECKNNSSHRWKAAWTNIRSKCYCPVCSEFHGEREIRIILTNNSLNIDKQITFPDCKYKRKLRFDFGIYDNLGNLLTLIEYDGPQHSNLTFFIGRKYFSQEEAEFNLSEQIKRDNIKTIYCENNHINLIRLNFKDLKENMIGEKLKYEFSKIGIHLIL